MSERRIPHFYYRQSAERLCLTEARAAELFGVDLATVRRWTSGETIIPDVIADWLETALLVRDYVDALKGLSRGDAHEAKLFGADAATVRAWASAEAPVPVDVALRLKDTRAVQRYVEAAKRRSLPQAYAAKLLGLTPRALRRLAMGERPVPSRVMARLDNALLVQRYREAARDLAMPNSLAAKVFRVNVRTVRRWLSGETPIRHSVVRAVEHMVHWQMEPVEWRRAQDRGIFTDTGGRWLHTISGAELAEQGLERDLVNGHWVIQPLGTRAARWDAPAARHKPCS